MDANIDAESPQPQAAGSPNPSPINVTPRILKEIGFLLLAGFALFRLPFMFPSQEVVASNSVNMGFNNGVAVLAVFGLLCLLILIRGLPSGVSHELLSTLPCSNGTLGSCPYTPMHRSVLALVLSVYLGVALWLFWALPALEEYGESGYFLHRIGLILQYGSMPYRDIEFGYGPALIYLPVGFAKLGHSMGFSVAACYLACYAVLCSLGVWLLFFVVDSLKLPLRRRTLLFLLFAATLFSISMGLQYLLVRFLLSPALLIGLHRNLPRMVTSGSWFRRSMAWCLCALAAFTALSVSPEVGLVYVICQSAGFLFRLARHEAGYLPCLLSTLATVPICWIALTPGYLATLFMFAKGGANFPLVPSMFVILFLGALFYTIPIAFGELRNHPRDPQSPLLLVLALHPLLTLPAALGRSDAGHIMLNGVGVFLLTFALLSRRSLWATRFFTIAVLVVFGAASQFSSFWLYAGYLKPAFAALAGRARPQEEASSALNVLKLDRLSGIATPLGVDRSTEDQLRAKGLFVSLYYPDTFDMGTPEHVEKQILGFKNVNYLLIPMEFLQFRSSQEIDSLWFNDTFRRQLEEPQQTLMRQVLLFPVAYKIKRKPYLPDLELAKYILSHYKPLRAGAGYALMVRKETGESSGLRFPLATPEG